MWASLAPLHLERQLKENPQLQRPWKARAPFIETLPTGAFRHGVTVRYIEQVLQKRWAKEEKLPSPLDLSRHERELIPSVLRLFAVALVAAREVDAVEYEGEEELETAAVLMEANEEAPAREQQEEAVVSDGGAAADTIHAAAPSNAVRVGRGKGDGLNGSCRSGTRGLWQYLERTMELIIDLLAQVKADMIYK